MSSMKPDYSDTKIGNLNKAFIVNSATNQPEFVADLFYPFWAVLRKSFIYSVLRNNGWSNFPCILIQTPNN